MKPVTHSASILTVGDELLNGDVVNTNAGWLGKALREMGVPCDTVLTVRDRMDLITQGIGKLWQDHDLVIVSGGLGPTRDDVTKKALLAFFDDHLVRDADVLGHVEQYFLSRGRTVSEVNRSQAEVPSRAQVLFNDLGTAPGLLFEQNGKLLAALPGVPYELHFITRERLIPELEKRWRRPERRVLQRYYRTTGIAESDLSDRVLSGLESRIPATVDIAFLPHTAGVDIRITQVNGDPESGFGPFADWVREKADEYIFSEDYACSLSAHIIDLLQQKGQTLALAESCTGGYLADALTDVPGSSRCILGGVVSYSNAAKTGLLGVDADVLARHGAVSAPVALMMARGATGRFGSDYAISTTGIAGPGGGSREKPVGTVWIGFWPRKGSGFACRFRFTIERLVNKERSFAAAMDLLRRHLNVVPGYPHNPLVVSASEVLSGRRDADAEKPSP